MLKVEPAGFPDEMLMGKNDSIKLLVWGMRIELSFTWDGEQDWWNRFGGEDESYYLI